MGSPSNAYEVVDTNYGNSCYLSAFATFLRVGLYEAHAILWGGPMPPEYGRLQPMRLPRFANRLKRLGFARREHPTFYTRTKQDALIVVAWDRGQCHTLHVVVWDAANKRRVDCSGYDTTARYDGLVLEAFTLTPEARAAIVTGVTTGLKRPLEEIEAERARWEAERAKAEETARARIRRSMPNAVFVDDGALSLGA